ncbi:MAG: hypothetical protein RL093_206, partial [Pseudomonadota bacterium]
MNAPTPLQDSARETVAGIDRATDRNAILFAAGVWSAELLQWSLRTWSNDAFDGSEMVVEKVVYNLIAFGLTSGIWAILRVRRPHTGWGFVLAATPLIFLASALNTLLSWGLYYLYNPLPDPIPLSLEWIRAAPQPLSYLWVFLTWACFVATMVGSAEVRARERALAESEKTIQEARLRALRYQVHPHLVFNSLNTIAALLETRDYPAAEHTLTLLSGFLRNTLAASSENMVMLHSELESQATYLGIEAVRFADRLTVTVKAGPEVRRALVPTLILQPLVENAVTHGLARSLKGAEIEIGAGLVADRLHLWVQDDAEPEGPGRRGLGIGLDNIRSRLAAQYGDNASLVAGPSGKGWR